MPSLRRHRADGPNDGSMTLMEHLHEFRHRLFLGVLSIFLGTIVGFIWFSVGIPSLHISTLGDLLVRPYCSVPSPPRVTFDGTGSCTLLATSAFSGLELRLTAGVMAGVVLSCPFWLYHTWAYFGPALKSNEKKFALTFSAAGAGLFAGGMVMAYLIIHEALTVLLKFSQNVVATSLDPNHYYKFLVGMMLVFGVSLELPLLLVLLNFAGVIKGAKLAHVRRYAFFGLVLFSGIAVPGNDPVSMGVLAVTLCVLYEVAVQITKGHDRHKAKRLAAAELSQLSDNFASDISDDTASRLTDSTPSSLDDGASPLDSSYDSQGWSESGSANEADGHDDDSGRGGDDGPAPGTDWSDVT